MCDPFGNLHCLEIFSVILEHFCLPVPSNAEMNTVSQINIGANQTIALIIKLMWGGGGNSENALKIIQIK